MVFHGSAEILGFGSEEEFSRFPRFRWLPRLQLNKRALIRGINLIAPPLYVVTTNTLERTEGLKRLNQALDAIKEEITSAKGVFNIKKEASVVSDQDEIELEKHLLKLEEDNQERAGDEDSDEDDEDDEEDENGGKGKGRADVNEDDEDDGDED
ncbi:eukaryotic translation initiation factor 2 subunit 1 [Plakobranchus ocellatus]|uniref:Eukaryotic translation initiation factor 2 subunit 1 n=1 Tax=Plakobranchus ocellatus TaxID=259542 RepID=A0AAV4BIV1_9GAST|nr:eukaryotic translation initiation factor 2 subunit 1 [Plakobranchus ocellatus]